MEFNLYIEEFAKLLYLPFGQVVYRLVFWYFGWLPIAMVFLYGISLIWLDYIADKWYATQKFVFLAIDVPKNNEQSPKAVENLFTYLMGTQGAINLVEKWWEGKFQLGFSFEIVGIDGYIQFLIRTPLMFRPIVETAVYSQYPDAEISEVADYTTGAPEVYPDSEYDLWGAEYVFTGPEALPIKLYNQFEHKFGKPDVKDFKDTLATLMDLLSSFKPGEQLWFQLLISPASNDWTKRSDKYIEKLLGPKPEGILTMPPSHRKCLEAASEKKNKVGFTSKIRTIYFARKDVMDKAKAVNGFNGYMRQYSEQNLNGFIPYKFTVTSTAYFQAQKRLNKRKSNIMRAYKGRSFGVGSNPYVMNIEELATIWHFPIDMVVKAPLLQRAASKRIEGPMLLPTEDTAASKAVEPIFDADYQVKEKVIFNQVKEDKSEDFVGFLEREIAKDEYQAESEKDSPPNNLPFV